MCATIEIVQINQHKTKHDFKFLTFRVKKNYHVIGLSPLNFNCNNIVLVILGQVQSRCERNMSGKR